MNLKALFLLAMGLVVSSISMAGPSFRPMDCYAKIDDKKMPLQYDAQIRTLGMSY